MNIKLTATIITILLLAEFSLGTHAGFGTLEKDNNDLFDSNEPVISVNSKEPLPSTPIVFTENRGQLKNAKVKYYTQGGGVWFTNDGVWLEVRDELSIISHQSTVNSPDLRLTTDNYRLTTKENELSIEGRESGVESRESRPTTNDQRLATADYSRVILQQEFIGAKPVRPEGKERLSWNSNFFYGNDPAKWRTEVPNYQEIYYENIYDGVDLRYYTANNGLKYDLIAHPGADLRQVRIAYRGAEALKLDDEGNLIVQNQIKNIIDGNLFIYQDFEGIRHQIDGRFKLYDCQEYGFEVLDDYRTQEALVIDPKVNLEYSTYIGGNTEDFCYGIEANSAGHAFITGRTRSNDYPITPGVYNESFSGETDIFVTKLNPIGSLPIYSTFIGGSKRDYGYAITINSTDYAFVTGETYSDDFPITDDAYDKDFNGGHTDVFILRLSPNGSELNYSTYIGSHVNTEAGSDIALDPIGNIYVAGETTSSFFPTTTGAFDEDSNGHGDGFALKLNHTGQKLDYSTFLGSYPWDYANAIAVDDAGNAYVTGETNGDDFPNTTGAYDITYNGYPDCFVVKIKPDGSDLLYSTFIGGTRNDYGEGIALDSMGNIYVTGKTNSEDFPNTTGAYDQEPNGDFQYDAFILKLNPAGLGTADLVFSTYLGGDNTDWGDDIAVDSVGNVYVSGITLSNDFPLTPDAYDTSQASDEPYLVQIAGNGSTLMYSTYLGGSGSDVCEGLALDNVGNAYITGYTLSPDFPTTDGVFNKTTSGNYDVFVSKFSFAPSIIISGVSLLQAGETTDSVYSQLCPYTFQVKVIDTASLTDLKDVQLTLDSLGTNIRLRWNRSTEQFSKIGDPNNYITLHPSSTATSVFGLWTIDFKVLFNWTYPDEDFHNIETYATSATLSTAWFNASSFYKVENDLEFNGTLKVIGEGGRLITNNSLIRGGEKLLWTGPVVVYEGCADTCPPTGEIGISICDEFANTYNYSPVQGDTFYIETITPKITNSEGYPYSLKITNIPTECDLTHETFTIRIDSENVTFTDPRPENNTWHISKDVVVGITVTDHGGGEVNSSTIKYSISTTDGTQWNPWLFIPGLEPAAEIEVIESVTLKEGIYNLIKWQASDSVGNGPVESDEYRILVDTESIIFQNPWPASHEVSFTEDVAFGITIIDATSGVNASTVEYALSTDKGRYWSPWIPVEDLNNSLKLDIRVNYTFPNGTENMVKWRAMDIAGNDIVESPKYAINVNSWVPPVKPEVTLLSPPNAMIINDTHVELTWEHDEEIGATEYDLYFDNSTPPPLRESGITSTNFSIDNLQDGETYFWRVIPKLDGVEGICRSGVWWFRVDLDIDSKSYDVEISGPANVMLYSGDNRSLLLTISNLGTKNDIIRLDLQASKLSNYISLSNYSTLNLNSNRNANRYLNIMLPDDVQPGTYEIIITATSINSGEIEKDNHIISVEIKGRDTPGPDDSDGDTSLEFYNQLSFQLIILAIIIIVIILVVAIALLIQRRKKRAEKLFPKEAVTVKPSPFSAPMLSMAQKPMQPLIEQVSTTSPISTPQQPITSSAPMQEIPPTPMPQQLPHIGEVPQLPPAEAQATISESGEGTPEIPTPTLAPQEATQQPVTTPKTPTTPTVEQPVSPTPTLAQPTVIQQEPTVQSSEVTKPDQPSTKDLMEDAKEEEESID